LDPNLYASHEQITEKYNRISIRINSLLASEARVQELLPEQKQRIELAAGLKCHYKIPSLGQPVPLKIRLASFKGMGSTYLSISQVFERPTKEVSEQTVLVKSKELNVSFKGDRKERFNKGWIYLTFECEREFAAILLVGFGKVKLYKVGKANTSAKASMMVKSEDEEKKEVFFRLEKVLRFTPSRIKSSMHSRIKTSEEVTRHRLQVKNLKEEREDEERCNIILKINKRKVNRMFDDLLQKKLRQIEDTRKSYMSLMVFSKLFKIAGVLYHKQKEARKKKENMEKKMQKLLRIYVFIKGKLGSIEPDYQQRIQKRLTMYYPHYKCRELIKFSCQNKCLALDRSARVVGWVVDEIDRKKTINQQLQSYLKASISYFFNN
jgi:hypothetical protein